MSSARPPAGPLHALDRLRMGTNHDFETDVRWSDDLAGNGSGEDSLVDAIDLVTLRGQVVFDLARKPKGLLVPHHRGDNDFLPAREEPPKLRGDIWSNSARLLSDMDLAGCNSPGLTVAPHVDGLLRRRASPRLDAEVIQDCECRGGNYDRRRDLRPRYFGLRSG